MTAAGGSQPFCLIATFEKFGLLFASTLGNEETLFGLKNGLDSRPNR